MIRIGGRNFRTVQESVEWLMTQYQFLTNQSNFVNLTRMGIVETADELPDPTITDIPYIVGTEVPYELYLVTVDTNGNASWTDAGQFPRAGTQGEQGVIGLTPAHRWFGTQLQFQQQDGTWGTLVDLRGARGLFASIGLTDPTYQGELMEVYLNVQTGFVFRFNGSIWQNFGTLRGTDGQNGLTPFIGTNNNWWIGDQDTGVVAVGQDGVDGQSVEIMSPVLNSATLLPSFASTSELQGWIVDDPSNPNALLYIHLVGGTDWDIVNWGKQGEAGTDGTDGATGARGASIWAVQGSTPPPTVAVNDIIINVAPSAIQIGSVILPVGGVALVTVTTPYTIVQQGIVTGTVPSISIGTVTTLPAGTPATVARASGDSDNAPVFNFGIPQGAQGNVGQGFLGTATLIGSVDGANNNNITLTQSMANFSFICIHGWVSTAGTGGVITIPRAVFQLQLSQITLIGGNPYNTTERQCFIYYLNATTIQRLSNTAIDRIRVYGIN